MNKFLETLEPITITHSINPPKGSSSSAARTNISMIFPPANTNIDLSSLKVYKRDVVLNSGLVSDIPDITNKSETIPQVDIAQQEPHTP